MQVGIVGTGMIVKEVFAVIAKIDSITCTSIYGRTKAAAEQLAAQHGIPHCTDNYELFLQNINMDTVYIGVVNNLHYAFVKAALEHGKHVICEKPFTETAPQARELIALAENKGLLLMEAVSFLYMPSYEWFARQVKRLQAIKLIQCSYCQYSSRYDSYLAGKVAPSLDPNKGGGCLFDINIYNLHLVVSLFGKPVNACYFANNGHNGVDTSGILHLQYPEAIAVCCAAKDSQSPSGAIVQGKNGYVRLLGPPHEFSGAESCIDGETEHFSGEVMWHRLADEWIAFSEIIRDRDYARCNHWLSHSLRVMEVVDLGIVTK